ncbi:hypothetical protein EVAR_79564_1 [Eumeta japonica]|uniref:Secreted protein n=1 Tax=Eumeta variegata TaxID=151549 RepID=A0A4C1UF27_EUMVA|nr:hypothetical protein EVAR_79564_1 [Eumeta japonica]
MIITVVLFHMPVATVSVVGAGGSRRGGAGERAIERTRRGPAGDRLWPNPVVFLHDDRRLVTVGSILMLSSGGSRKNYILALESSVIPLKRGKPM